MEKLLYAKRFGSIAYIQVQFDLTVTSQIYFLGKLRNSKKTG